MAASRKTPSPPIAAAGYSHRSLAQKLGIKAGHRVAFVDVPDDVVATLQPELAAVTVRRDARGALDLALWFVRDLATLTKGLPRWGARDDVQALWICWPKKASGIASDVDETAVRTRGIAAGLVDYKICAIDATWSGHKFAWQGRAKKETHGRVTLLPLTASNPE